MHERVLSEYAGEAVAYFECQEVGLPTATS